MKLEELMEERRKAERGTYAGVRYAPKTVEAIQSFLKEHSIPNPVASEKLHTTLLYSRKYLPHYEAQGSLENPIKAKFDCYDVWKTSPQDESQEPWNCLVMKLHSPELVELHEKYMKEHQATFDYSHYHPHITLSYNIGDLDVSNLPNFSECLHIVEEYKEDLNLNWAVTHGTKK